MLTRICILTALGIALAAIGVSCQNRHVFRKRITIILAGILFSSLFLFFPSYLKDSCCKTYPILRAAAHTLCNALKALSGSQDMGVIGKFELESDAHWGYTMIYYVLNYIYLVAAPLLTSGLIISFVGDLTDRLRCRFLLGRKCLVFSELNSVSLSLAESHQEKYPRDRLIFCNTKGADENLIPQARALGAVLLYASCTEAKLPLWRKTLLFYLISQNEDENLCCATALILKYKDKNTGTVVINAFAESGTGIETIESMDKGGVGVRFVDVTTLLCSHLLIQHPLNRLPVQQNTISLAIIGCGKTGMRMLKTAVWCGQTEGHKLKIRVYDKEADLLDKKLQAQCPQLKQHCDIAFVVADARAIDLEDQLLKADKGSPDATSIVLATGDDELNISAAERIFRRYRHQNNYGWTPQILVRIRDERKADLYHNLDAPYLEQRRIYSFGSLKDVFREGTLYHSHLENLAFAVHLCYSDLLPDADLTTKRKREQKAYFASDKIKNARSKFLQSDYFRRSSMAAALHIPVKLRSCGILNEDQNIPDAGSAERFRTLLAENPEKLGELSEGEHLRWNQFMRSEGYVRAEWVDLQCFYPTLKKSDNKDYLSKRHLCLTEWDQLDGLYKQYLTLGPENPKNFEENDRKLVSKIPEIILLAECMADIDPDDPR